MVQRPEKVAAGLLFLVGLWIAVYWLWEPNRPEISFGHGPDDMIAETSGTIPSPPTTDQLQPPRFDQGVGAAPPKIDTGTLGPIKVDKTTEPVLKDPPDKAESTQPQPAVIAPEFEDYVVQKGDTFAAISTRFFGTPVHAQAIVRANPLMDPRRLMPGRTIRVPKDPANIQGKPVAPPAKGEEGHASVYVVQSGDTLSGISQRLFGSMKHADLIFQANRDRLSSPESLRVGQTLNIPPKPKSE
ncbi:MAG: LysM peptidoglycan-binding domain-containing protein [Phycisphaerales bacterium]|nr:LysM peptidoglycan-binding domain-containing protein [Phycisphaerales bacterium]